MNKKIFHIISFVVGFTLLMGIGCKSFQHHPPSWRHLPIDSTISEHQLAKQLIEPYKIALDSEMNEVLVISSMEFPKEKGKPETLLGNLVADLSIETAKNLYYPTDGHTIDFCLLNIGGLRTSLPKGEITRGKIFELMPFDNELVVVTIDESKMLSLTRYLIDVGGQPIAGNYGLTVDKPKKGTDNITVRNDSSWYKTEFIGTSPKKEVKILTTDYLAQGGDNMSFFLTPIKMEPIGIKLRDAIIEYCTSEHKKGNQLTSKLDGRIHFK